MRSGEWGFGVAGGWIAARDSGEGNVGEDWLSARDVGEDTWKETSGLCEDSRSKYGCILFCDAVLVVERYETELLEYLPLEGADNVAGATFEFCECSVCSKGEKVFCKDNCGNDCRSCACLGSGDWCFLGRWAEDGVIKTFVLEWKNAEELFFEGEFLARIDVGGELVWGVCLNKGRREGDFRVEWEITLGLLSTWWESVIGNNELFKFFVTSVSVLKVVRCKGERKINVLGLEVRVDIVDIYLSLAGWVYCSRGIDLTVEMLCGVFTGV